MKGIVVWEGYVTGSKKAKEQLEKAKEDPQMKKFLEEASDFIDKKAARGELE